ncbi:5029_t:CDS:2, partial [Paraglomus brasilianum]
MKHCISFTLVVFIICYLLTEVAPEKFHKALVVSSLKAGTKCHGYVTDCKGNVLFDRGLKDCSKFCTVSKRDNIPNAPFCSHMIVVDSNGKYYDQTIKSETDACFKVSGDAESGATEIAKSSRLKLLRKELRKLGVDYLTIEAAYVPDFTYASNKKQRELQELREDKEFDYPDFFAFER